MSYSFGMFFVPASSLGKAMEYAHAYTKAISEPETIKKILEDELYYFPSNRFAGSLVNSIDRLEGDEKEKIKERVKDFVCHTTDEYFAYYVLTLNFVYFPKVKLLALCGFNYPETEKFFKKHIYFQNSTDQDYTREDWKGIKCFEKIFDECSKLLPSDFPGYFDDVAAENIIEVLEYVQRSKAYEKIYDTLDLDNWLWDKPDNENYIRFSLSLLNTSEQRYRILPIVREIKKKI